MSAWFLDSELSISNLVAVCIFLQEYHIEYVIITEKAPYLISNVNSFYYYLIILSSFISHLELPLVIINLIAILSFKST